MEMGHLVMTNPLNEGGALLYAFWYLSFERNRQIFQRVCAYRLVFPKFIKPQLGRGSETRVVSAGILSR
jgi:hypothetical protein